MSAVDDAFTSLFFGAGSWLGLILIILLTTGIALKWKYGGLLMLPVTILVGIQYLDHALGWHAAIMFVNSIFLIFVMAKELRK